MAQPEFVSVRDIDDVREGERLPPAVRWEATRPGDVVDSEVSHGDGFGAPGPDQGYALFLAKRFHDKLELIDGDHRADAVAGGVAVAMKRASFFGRGPTIYDLEFAFALWGYLGGGASGLIAKRKELFAGAAHDYWKRRAIVDAVPEATLRLTPAAVKAGIWSDLLAV
ncbi:MAG: hypothetical protein H0U92_12130 [Actinobacteria bacterium]|nr:hypothetical protein [Actinomycetota bacterium]